MWRGLAAVVAAVLVGTGASVAPGPERRAAAHPLAVATGEAADGDRYEVAVTDDCVHVFFEDGRGARACAGPRPGLHSGTLVDRRRGRRVVFGFVPPTAVKVSIRSANEAWTLPVTALAGGKRGVYAGALLSAGPSVVEIVAVGLGGRPVARERLRF